ncbi:MAG: flavin reductase family protein [Pelolinea sp.]|nr:flavin reductase family protein [Pelolinea sp.]
MNGIITLENKGKVLKHVMRNWASGVAVLTSGCMGARAGTTVSSFTSLSLEPPLVLVNIAKENPLQTMIGESGYFGLSVLDDSQREISNLFAGFGKRIQDRFEDVETFTLTSESPLIMGAIAHLDCKVYNRCELPKSVVVIGEVIDGTFAENDDPLLYFNRDYAALCRPLSASSEKSA